MLLLFQIPLILYSLGQYVIQDVHFTNYQDETFFKMSLDKWKSMSPVENQSPDLYHCGHNNLHLVKIVQVSNNLKWITPSPKIAPSQAPQAFYSISIEADILYIIGNGYRPAAKLILKVDDQSTEVFVAAGGATQYDNEFGNLCQGTPNHFVSSPFYAEYTASSPVSIQLVSEGMTDGLQGLFSIKNLIIRYAYCHQSCNSCLGPEIDQCIGQCPVDSESVDGRCLCNNIQTCRCPLNICSFVYYSVSIDISQGLTYNNFGFDQNPSITSTSFTYSTISCFQFSLKQGYLLLINTIRKQTYMIVVTYQIIIQNPQGAFELQFDFNDNNNKSIVSYSRSKYFFSNINQHSVDENIEPQTDQLQFSIIFLQSYASISKLKIQGNFLSSSTSWLLCSISIRQIGCQDNCKQCLNYYQCTECQDNFYLFNGTCLYKCPGGYKSTALNKKCKLDTLSYTINNCKTFIILEYQLISYLFFDFNTSKIQADESFDCHGINMIHSVMSNDAAYAKRVLGGILTFGNIQCDQSFQVPANNYGAIIQFKFYRGDKYENQLEGVIQFDDENPIDLTNRYEIQQLNIIGDMDSESINQYQYIRSQNILRNIYVSIQCRSALPINYSFCAVSDFIIILLKCKDGCSSCSTGTNCNAPLLTCDSGQYFLDNVCVDIPILGCAVFQNSVCSQCKINFQIINFACYCNQGYYLNSDKCEKCDQSCQTCNGRLASNCTTCNDGQLLIEGTCRTCLTGYETCLYYQCLIGQLLINFNCFSTINLIQNNMQMHQSASLGFENLNNLITFSLVQNNQFCGNNITEGNEQCDDGNLISFDGCDIHCRYQCPQDCLTCINGLCNECVHGWKVDNGQCNVIYNDGYIVPGYEECDDGNTIEYDGCNNGQSQCDKYCQTCSSGRCQNCQIGTQFNSHHICQSVCGDGIVFGNEQCDDGNDIEYDGCYNCLYQCQSQCLNCQQGVCQSCSGGYLYNQHCYDCTSPCFTCDRFQCLTCQKGWYPIDNYCQTQCGDGIVAGTEECDSSSNCWNCIYVLPSNCVTMVQGICKYCTTGYQLNSSNECVAICGNGIIQSGEQCDDGNTRNYDGCSSECQTESAQNFDGPYMQLTQLFSNEPNIQLVQIVFSQQLYYNMNLSAEQLFNVSVIDQSTPIQANIEIIEINRYFKYQVTIMFQQTVNQPVLLVQLIYNLVNQQNISLQENQKIIILQSQYYYSQTELHNLNTSSNVVEYSIYMIMSLCVITYLLGKQEVCYNFLDILQRCSYLQQINLSFPYLLQYFFQVFDNVSLNFVFELFGVRLNSINFPQYQSPGTFSNTYNALLLANVFQLLYTLGSIIYSAILYRLSESLQQIDLSINKITIYCFSTLWSTIRQIRMINFREILNSSCYDNTISVMLQLNALYFNTDIYNIISLSLMLIIIIYLYYDIVRTWALLSQIFKKYQKNSMKINSTNIWSSQYQGIFYLKKIAFCINLVCVQSNQTLQIIIFIILTLANLVLVYKLEPFQNKLEQSKLIIEESFMLIIYISFLSIIDGLTPLTIEQQNYVNWLIIGLFVACMGVLLIMDIYNLVFIEFRKPLKKLLNNIKEKIKAQSQDG